MNWDATGAVGEIIGAIAVVVSVVYLGLQIRKQANESRFTAARELCSQFILIKTGAADNRDRASLYLKAIRDYESLPDEERLMMSFTFDALFRVMEQQFLHVQAGNVDSQFFRSLNAGYREWVCLPGVKRWWELSRHMYGTDFGAHIDNEVKLGEEEKIGSTFAAGRLNPPTI
jgi:hypothetical protein